jgi:hypothetical protein
MIGTVIKTIINIILSLFKINRNNSTLNRVKDDKEFAKALKEGNGIKVGQKWKKRKTYSQ